MNVFSLPPSLSSSFFVDIMTFEWLFWAHDELNRLFKFNSHWINTRAWEGSWNINEYKSTYIHFAQVQTHRSRFMDIWIYLHSLKYLYCCCSQNLHMSLVTNSYNSEANSEWKQIWFHFYYIRLFLSVCVCVSLYYSFNCSQYLCVSVTVTAYGKYILSSFNNNHNNN